MVGDDVWFSVAPEALSWATEQNLGLKADYSNLEPRVINSTYLVILMPGADYFTFMKFSFIACKMGIMVPYMDSVKKKIERVRQDSWLTNIYSLL